MRKVLYITFLSLFLLPVCVKAEPVDIYSDVTIQEGDSYGFINVHGNATLTVTGGTIGNITALDNSTINILGGNSYDIKTSGNNNINVTGGAVSLLILGSGLTNITGGVIKEISSGGSGIVNVQGGKFDGFISLGGSTIVNLHKLDYDMELHMSKYLSIYQDAILNVYGSNLAIEELPELGGNFLTGNLENGAYFALRLRNLPENSPQIILHEVPEPTIFALLGLGGLILRKFS